MSALGSIPEIDEELYSRQLYVLGREAMQKMASAVVLVSGMKGLGVEIAKNIILAGVKYVTVHDRNVAQWSDLSSQFYLSENDIGQNRAMVSQRHLQDLNSYARVECYTEGLSESFLSKFQVVVLTNSPLEEQQRIGDFCHSNNLCFILADTKGLAGQLFCDFGEHFVVYDPSDTEPASAVICRITQGNPGIVTVACEGERKGHHFEDGDWVTFSKVEGMTELNHSEPRRVHVKGQYSLEIGDTASFSPYKCSGIITQVKKPQKHSFESLRASMADPKIKTPEKGKLSHYHTLHSAFWALHVFQSEMQRLPRPWDQADADKMVELSQTRAVGKEPLDEHVIRAFANGCTGDLSPISSFIGALAAQEVLKAASGKFTPLDQWLYFDAFECLPEKAHAVLWTEKDCAPRGSRYDGQIAIFGADFQERLGKQKYFVVGAGAIGCELLKNFAMIGLAASEGGNITVTDMDTIENSNLSRQFLFRRCNVSMPKSEVAATAMKLMNPHVNVIAEQNQVGPDTECLYGDDFFLGLDGVASALDSMQAREYVGNRCVQYLKPLLDAGTQGTQGHAQVFVPFLTEAYGQSENVDETEHPLCTLRYFPSTIQHTIQWARDQFEGLFKTRAVCVNNFHKDSSFLDTQEVNALEMLELVQISFQEKPHSLEDCVAWARRLWERLFSQDIQQLLHNFPPNLTTHMDFILAASRLYAQTYNLNVNVDNATACQILLNLHLTPFQPHDGVHIPFTDQEMQKSRSTIDEMKLAKLKQELTTLRQQLEEQDPYPPCLMKPIHFEKDVDSNSHLDFIMTAANLRAENFHIPPADKLQTKKILGGIIPAIVTTTAAVAGLVCLELYKLVGGHRCLGSYRSSFLQLSEPRLHRFEPQSPQTSYKYHQMTWRCWDRIEVPGVDASKVEISLKGLCEHLQRKHNLVLRRLLYGKARLYDRLWGEKKREQQLSNRLTDVVRCVTGKKVPKDCRLLVFGMVCEDEEEDDALPPIHVCLQPMSSSE